MAVFERAGDFGVGVHEGFGERVDDSRATATVVADKGDVLAAAVGEDMNNLVNDAGIFGLLDFVGGTLVAVAQIGGKML